MKYTVPNQNLRIKIHVITFQILANKYSHWKVYTFQRGLRKKKPENAHASFKSYKKWWLVPRIDLHFWTLQKVITFQIYWNK